MIFVKETFFLGIFLIHSFTKILLTMEKKDFTRREFIKTTAIGTTALLATGCGVANGLKNAYETKGLPTVVLGKTGVRIPRIALGCGSRFLGASTEEGIAMLNYALDNGLYYWDTANSYINRDRNEASEERLGKVLKTRRKEVFLATKLGARKPDEVKQQLETSLKRLQTDHVDLLNIHSITSVEDAKNMGPVIETFRSFKEQGITRFIGFTGHTTAEGMAYMAKNYGLDFMLMALNHQVQDRSQAFEGLAVPTASKEGLGVMVMKVIRPREKVESLTPEQLIRYALSIQGAHGAVLSMHSREIMQKNIELLRSFKPMSEDEFQKTSMALEPFYRSNDMDWMLPGYQDGVIG